MAAGNLTLLAFAAATPSYWAQAVQQSTDISCLPGKQQQTRRTLLPAITHMRGSAIRCVRSQC